MDERNERRGERMEKEGERRETAGEALERSGTTHQDDWNAAAPATSQ